MCGPMSGRVSGAGPRSTHWPGIAVTTAGTNTPDTDRIPVQDKSVRKAPVDAPPALKFDGVSKRFGKRQVVERMDLRIDAGCYFALVGVNGAGKTTCMKALLNFQAIDAGTIEIFGRDHRADTARAPLAFLPERFLPPYYLTGWDFLRYTVSLDGSLLDRERAMSVCQAIDFDLEALNRPVREFSKGMGQKLGLSAAFLRKKPLLILDEPMSGLDPKARLLVKNYLKKLKNSGQTLFFSTHMLADVDDICDQMGILHDGSLQFVGSTDECRSRYAQSSLESAYLACISSARPQANQAPA